MHQFLVYLVAVFAIVIIKGKCQASENTPPTLWLDRNWRIPETEPVGSVIVRAHGGDNENDNLEYGLEPLNMNYNGGKDIDHLPFRIDNKTGVIYLNESLKGRGGENIFLYVTVFDGKLTAKTEVWVNILKEGDKNNGGRASSSRNGPMRPNLFSTFNRGTPPPAIANNPPPHPGLPIFQKKSTLVPNSEISKVHLQLINSTTTRSTTSGDVEYKTRDIDLKQGDSNQLEEKNSPKDAASTADESLKAAQDVSVTLVPVVIVCGIFLAVAVLAVVLRKKICWGKIKKAGNDKEKESTRDIALRDDPSLTMQHWRGPRAFNNRYEPWDGESHVQASSQLSVPPKTGDPWEFPRHRLKVFNILGEGAFGQVWKCEATDIDGKEGVSIVAVKTLKENASEKERSDLISELNVMKTLEAHPNVVRLLGCCTEKDPIFVIMEFVSKGKLQSYLRNSRAERYYNNMHGQSKTLTSRDLTSFVYQVAKGMEFLSANGIIHRDLAARNVLITDDHICKVADFGFARDVTSTYVYERKSEGRLPIRWMAPESLYDNIFSVKSDVWSFGVLIWEVVTLGSTPYPGLSAAEVMKRVRDGHRLEKPEHCRRELYNIMYYCWDKDPKERPTFSECIELLEKLLMTETDYIELERFPDHSYYNMLSLSGEKV
ncbi:tyrosine kinase receptor Cad96Ca [Agrilus planipennis]|uniref:receptor protein-tyrosine kinase n=1 Tax=Agrilus planipennis TaxID=224129 RepID=A0A1W4WE94_AGRPL|nr:tyrosine kinase receptor Cad96Ca [Agrilus planipennis]